MAYPGLHKEEVKIIQELQKPTNITIEYNLGTFNEQTYTPTNTPTQTPTETPTEVPYIAPIYEKPYAVSNVAASYYWGQCVQYASIRRPDLPNLGNARDWLWNAQRLGIQTGSSPIAGAVVSLDQGWYGHVAYVESFDGGSIYISEWNAQGLGVLSYRNIGIDNPDILGYIYE